MAAYFASGVVVATLVSRLPSVRDGLGLTHGQVGLLLLSLTLGAFVSVSLSGLVVLRVGSGHTIRGGALLVSVALAAAGIGVGALGSVPATGSALALLGAGTACWNVASNVQGAAMETELGRAIMPVLHGCFSVGTIVGAGAGALASWLSVPVGWHYSAAAAGVAALVLWAARAFRADTGGTPAAAAGTSAGSGSVMGRTWREPRTVLLGAMVLGMALAEGAAGDWVALALADGYATTNAVGALGYGVFVTAMATARLGGGRLLERIGPVAAMRASAVAALAGVLLFVGAGSVPLAFAGLALWGLGVALVFPVAMTAASDDPLRAAARVSVVSTIGYGAFLCGPPLLGLLADRIGLLNALAALAVLVVASFFLAGNTRPSATAATGGHRDSD